MNPLKVVVPIFLISISLFVQLATNDVTSTSSKMLFSELIQTSFYPKILSYLLICLPPLYCLWAFTAIVSSKNPLQRARLSCFVILDFCQWIPTFLQLFNLLFIIRNIGSFAVGLRLPISFVFVVIRFILIFRQNRRKRTRSFLIDLALMLMIEASLLRYASSYFNRIIRKISLVTLLYQLNQFHGEEKFWSDFSVKYFILIRWIFVLMTIILPGIPMLLIPVDLTKETSSPTILFKTVIIGSTILLICFILFLLISDSNQIIQRVRSTTFRSTTTTNLKRTCQVCYEDKTTDEFEIVIFDDCQHDQRTICNSCIYQHVTKAFEITFTDDIFCPEPSCRVKFSYNTVKRIFELSGSKVLLERYDKYVAHRELENMDEFIWCSNPDCHAGQLNEGGEINNIVTCHHCRQRTCFIHKVKWHEGLTCNEYTESTDAEQNASRQWIVENCKKCPNCPYEIQKNDGCDHMTCIQCRHEFCWSCLADFQPIRQDGNHRHRPTCKHYAAYDG